MEMALAKPWLKMHCCLSLMLTIVHWQPNWLIPGLRSSIERELEDWFKGYGER
jgi:hypothetical protein